MNTVKLNPTVDLIKEETVRKGLSIYKHIAAFAESQAPNRAGWFMGSLLWQGVLCLPVPAFLIYYYQAPIWVLFVTVLLFFINMVAGMAGSKISVVLGLLAGGTLLHIVMVLAFVL